MKVNALNHMLCWKPGTDQVALVPWPNTSDRQGRLPMSGLACYSSIHKMTFEERKARVFIEAMHLIVRDKCDPMAVHLALLPLEEYRAGCSADMPGAFEERKRHGEEQPGIF